MTEKKLSPKHQKIHDELFSKPEKDYFDYSWSRQKELILDIAIKLFVNEDTQPDECIKQAQYFVNTFYTEIVDTKARR